MVEKVKIPLRLDIIQSFAALCFSDNRNILFRDFLSLKNLLDQIDSESIQVSINEISSAYYFEMINFFLREKVEKKVLNNSFIRGKLIEESANREIYKQIIESLEEVSNEDLSLIRNFINERIRFLYLYQGANSLDELLLDLKTNNFESLEQMSINYEDIIKQHFSTIIRTKNDQSEVLNDLELDDEGISTLAGNLHDTLNSKGHVLKTGIKELDEAFPLVRGELTLFGGPSGGFKSGTLLNLFYNTLLYNPIIECNDPTKKPAILYISMENTQKITFSRSIKLLLNMNRSEVADTNPEAVAAQFKRKLDNFPTSCKNAVSKLKYYPGRTISVEDIYGLVEQEEQQGNEVVAVFIDYIRSLKPESHSRNSELRIQMADSSRAMADLAISKEIAVVSAFQLNRAAIEANSLNPVHIQEAFSIIDHADNLGFIRRVYSPNLQRRFLQVFESKGRNNEEENSEEKECHFIPFDKDNSFRIVPTAIEGNEFENQTIDIRVAGSDNSQKRTAPSASKPNKPQTANIPEFKAGTKLAGGNASFFES